MKVNIQGTSVTMPGVSRTGGQNIEVARHNPATLGDYNVSPGCDIVTVTIPDRCMPVAALIVPQVETIATAEETVSAMRLFLGDQVRVLGEPIATAALEQYVRSNGADLWVTAEAPLAAHVRKSTSPESRLLRSLHGDPEDYSKDLARMLAIVHDAGLTNGLQRATCVLRCILLMHPPR